MLIEALSEYRFDAQLGMAIVFWGVLVTILLTIIGAIHNFILDVRFRIKCDGCKKVINGEYIVFRPDETEYKFNYCGKECRNEYHPQNMKGIGRNWAPSE